ncbi:MAG TPA: NUDIX domain-containing protein [Candidatus Paceibacterota bacterium]|nr:NUDIX domain-containing protein [Candidatus Paceibacterota bacterium]
MKDRHKVKTAAHAILERDGMILLARRFNTGFADGLYQMPSGHTEVDEYPVEAAAREAKEEVGVDIVLEDLELVHASYRINKDDHAGDYVDFYFRTTKWSGEPYIAEPEKCDQLIWAAIDELPGETIAFIQQVLADIRTGIPFSQIGR